jgi:GNAT superfamily N-acetyltransferase
MAGDRAGGARERVTERIRVVPANEAPWTDVTAVFGTRGAAAYCWCQRYKLAPKEAFSRFPAEERAMRLRQQTNAGDPTAASTSGLIAYEGDEPVGWCAVEPRPSYESLLRAYRVPWEGRAEDKADPSVWALTCILVRAGRRGHGISYALVRGAVEFARERGARALEGYPFLTGKQITWDEIHVGAQGMFVAAGFREVSRPGVRRAVMRVDFQP